MMLLWMLKSRVLFREGMDVIEEGKLGDLPSSWLLCILEGAQLSWPCSDGKPLEEDISPVGEVGAGACLAARRIDLDKIKLFSKMNKLIRYNLMF